MTIEIRNLHRNAIETDLRRLFTPFGELGPVEILRDRNNSRSMGRAIVNMPVDKEAKQAATSLNGSLILGQQSRSTCYYHQAPRRKEWDSFNGRIYSTNHPKRL
jgi:RNA recognition motif-containing protein